MAAESKPLLLKEIRRILDNKYRNRSRPDLTTNPPPVYEGQTSEIISFLIFHSQNHSSLPLLDIVAVAEELIGPVEMKRIRGGIPGLAPGNSPPTQSGAPILSLPQV
jgi:hypothetical protein